MSVETSALAKKPTMAVGKGRLALNIVMNIRSLILPVIFVAVILLIWEWFVPFYEINHVLLPPPTEIGSMFVKAFPIFLVHIVPTAIESAVAFLLAVVGGVGIAIAITQSPIIREAVYPNLVVFALLPKVALAPLFIIWFGIGPEMRLAFSAFISFFPVVIATSAGLTSVHPDMLRLAQSLTATDWQTFTTVRFPFALPYIFSGMKIAMTFSIIGVIVGEFITSQRGIGYLILLASSKAETDLIFAGMIVLSAMGLALYGTVAFGEWLINKRYSSS